MSSAAHARAALDTAESGVVVDGRATAWGVLAQLLNLGAFVNLLVALDLNSVPLWLSIVVFVILQSLSVLCTRASGVQPKPLSRRVILAFAILAIAAAGFLIALDVETGFVAGLLVAGVAGAVVIPVARWTRARRRGRNEAWGPETQAFAILSMLDRSQAMMPAYLLARAGLEPEAGALWIERLRAEHLLMGGQARRRPLGPAWLEMTQTGRERLERMRAELEAQAAAELPVA